MHNISAYIEPCMTSKKSFGNPQIPLSPGPGNRCFQKIAKTRGFYSIFLGIVHFTITPHNTFPCGRPQFFGGGVFEVFFAIVTDGVECSVFGTRGRPEDLPSSAQDALRQLQDLQRPRKSRPRWPPKPCFWRL